MSSRPSSSRPGAVRPWQFVGLVLAGIVLILFAVGRYAEQRGPSPSASPPTGPAFPTPASPPIPAVNPIQQALEPKANVERKAGIGVAVLVDVSGSMSGKVPDANGRLQPKIEIARRSVLDLLRQCDKAARENPDRNIQVGVYEFSSRDRQPPCRTITPIGPLDLAVAEVAVRRMVPMGNTPIGNAIITAKQDLDRTGLSRLHILVVTDGENNQGYAPVAVVEALAALPEGNRASVYFIAFDIAAAKFRSVRDAGGLVLAASNETELQHTLDYVLTGKILAEQPEAPPSR